jgi:hypothetical protein
MRITERHALLALTIAGALLFSGLLTGCGKSAPQPAEAAQGAASKVAPAAPSSTPSAPFNMTSIFPPGPGRELVLNTCGSCHSAVCATRGQRTADRWESIKKDHKDKLTAISNVDLNTMFSYLAANFNETKPEPQVPAELLQQGCTPF